MKFFLKKVLLIISIPLLLLVFFLGYVSYITKSYKISDEISEIIVGDSHVGSTIDVKQIQVPYIKNIGIPAESYYYSYYKIKHLISINPRINKVYLGMGCHNLSDFYDLFIEGERSYFYGAPYFHVLPFREKIRSLNWSLSHVSSFLKNIIESGFKSLKDKPSFLGEGFLNNSLLKLSSKDKADFRINEHYYNGDKPKGFSELNLLYLEKIIEMIKENNLELIILNTPTAPYYESRIPELFKNKYKEITKKYNLKIIDFSELELKDPKYFMPDGDHLNSKGAYLVSKEFKRIMLSN